MQQAASKHRRANWQAEREAASTPRYAIENTGGGWRVLEGAQCVAGPFKKIARRGRGSIGTRCRGATGPAGILLSRLVISEPTQSRASHDEGDQQVGECNALPLQPKASNRQIAKTLGTGHSTIDRDVAPKWAASDKKSNANKDTSASNGAPPTIAGDAAAKLAQRDFVAWWTANVSVRKSVGTKNNAALHSTLTLAQAEKQTGVRQYQVSRWRTGLKRPAIHTIDRRDLDVTQQAC